MDIRIARPEDAEAVGEIRVRAWRAAYRGQMPAEYLDSLDATANLEKLKTALGTQDPPFLMKVAELGKRVVAFSIVGAPRYEAAKDTAELWTLNVDPSCWRQGVGRQLVRAALADALAQNHRRLELWCLVGNAAASALYETSGFVRNGKQRTTSTLTGSPLTEMAYERLL
jgi:ribosomal protein S18 acetylase RimI-like enzyme